MIEIAFRSNDDGNWASGVALDNIRLGITPKWISASEQGYVHYRNVIYKHFSKH